MAVMSDEKQYHGRMVVALPSGTYGTIDMIAERRGLSRMVAVQDFRCVTPEDRDVAQAAYEAADRLTKIPPGGDTPEEWFKESRAVWGEMRDRGIRISCRWADRPGDPFPNVGRPMTPAEESAFNAKWRAGRE